MRDGDERRQSQRPARSIEPGRIGLRRRPQRVFITDRTRQIGTARCDIGAFDEHPSSDAGIGAIDPPSVDIAGIDEPEPMQHAGCMIVAGR